MTFTGFMRSACRLLLMVFCFAVVATAQTETATISGLIVDGTGAVVPGAEVKLQSVDRGSATSATTNNTGIYIFASVHPGQYQLTVHKPGFKQVDFLGLIVNVQDHIEQNFRLQVGSVAESVTVEAGALTINTQDATVSTVIDRQFAENLPMNGRSFQTLIELTPGVVIAAPSAIAGYDSGQFSINGQRASSNYWTVDGVSANIGTSANFQGDGIGGAIGSFSALGGTNSLVSVDALQEFRIQTSTYAPEFGRTPGGQISIATRSGTNGFHGTLFDYLRNDAFDANTWFADNAGLPKPKERQNDFGGTFSGPIVKDRTFFFVSYEGLRLQLPQVAQTEVPDVQARQNAIPALQPYLNAFPLPTPGTPDDTATGVAQFNSSFSNPATLDAYSIRVDHRLSDKLALFGRYNYSPSNIVQHGSPNEFALSELASVSITTQTATVGATWMISPTATNDLRFNYSRVNAASGSTLDNFGGAVPLPSLGLPSPFTDQNARLFVDILSLSSGAYDVGQNVRNLQRQVNVVDSVSLQIGSHSLKFGVDFRRLSPAYSPFRYGQAAFFFDVPSAELGNVGFASLQSNADTTILFHNLGTFAQDTWRARPRLTLTYGLRWDVDFAPSTASGVSFPAVTGFNLNDLSQLAVAPPGTSAFRTPYWNIAPRLGVAYQISQSQNWGTVFRSGFGVFYDLATQQVGNLIGQGAYPFGANSFTIGGVFPLSSTAGAPPPITPPGSGFGTVVAFDPTLQLPFTLEWNVSLEQELGSQQALSASYVGSAGRRLIQTANIFSPNPNYADAILVGNTATSDYDALQLQFQRRLSHGLQVLSSYTWSHSIDTASAGSFGSSSNAAATALSGNRGPSDFDIRKAFSAAVTYEIPTPSGNVVTDALLRGWAIQNVIQARSAPPSTASYGNFSAGVENTLTAVRPDLIPGLPLYLYGPQYPGGKIFNNTPGQGGPGCIGPFCPPPVDANGNPLRQGDLSRNALRGFGATQWDFAVHRDFRIHETLKLQFRAEFFNILNHPNFAPPVSNLNDPKFGMSTQTLGQSFTGGVSGSGALSPLYQLGGPRSIQLALKFFF